MAQAGPRDPEGLGFQPLRQRLMGVVAGAFGRSISVRPRKTSGSGQGPRDLLQVGSAGRRDDSFSVAGTSGGLGYPTVPKPGNRLQSV